MRTSTEQIPIIIYTSQFQYLPQLYLQIAEFIFPFFTCGKTSKQYVLSVTTTATKKNIYSDSHLDLTFLWLRPKQFKRLKNFKTSILTNLRTKYQEKIQRATRTVFFNWMCLRTLSDYCDVFNTTRARSCPRMRLRRYPFPGKSCLALKMLNLSSCKLILQQQTYAL